MITDEMVKAALIVLGRAWDQNDFARMKKSLEAAERAAWQPIETAPESGQFLATTWEPGDPWSTDVELLNAPVMSDGRVFCQNSGNYQQIKHYRFWRPLLDPPR